MAAAPRRRVRGGADRPDGRASHGTALSGSRRPGARDAAPHRGAGPGGGRGWWVDLRDRSRRRRATPRELAVDSRRLGLHTPTRRDDDPGRGVAPGRGVRAGAGRSLVPVRPGRRPGAGEARSRQPGPARRQGPWRQGPHPRAAGARRKAAGRAGEHPAGPPRDPGPGRALVPGRHLREPHDDRGKGVEGTVRPGAHPRRVRKLEGQGRRAEGGLGEGQLRRPGPRLRERHEPDPGRRHDQVRGALAQRGDQAEPILITPSPGASAGSAPTCP
jgi:hypothetical protein